MQKYLKFDVADPSTPLLANTSISIDNIAAIFPRDTGKVNAYTMEDGTSGWQFDFTGLVVGNEITYTNRLAEALVKLPGGTVINAGSGLKLSSIAFGDQL
jgi:hypothetical protein